MNRRWSSLMASLGAIAMTTGIGAADEPTKAAASIRFEKHQLDATFRSEGVAVGDFNKDGKADIAAGYVWYEAPEWKPHSIIEKMPEYDPVGYSNSFCAFAQDLNGDAWVDIMVVDFPGTPTWWFENPKGASGAWAKHTCTPVTNNESPQFVDVDGDGRRDLLMAFAPDPQNPDGRERRMGYGKPTSDPKSLWQLTAISEPGAPGTQKYAHGCGVGDVNGDGRADILCSDGWWECPASSDGNPWAFHRGPFGNAAHMFVHDFDGDGDGDVLTSSPHAYGIWWHEQTAADQWKTHEVDRSFSQTHSVCMADLNGDGLTDFVTGKRWWAHAKGDPGGDEPAVICWFEFSREGGKPRWVKHQFDHDSGVGTQFEIADVDGDGLLDVVTSNKKGVHFFRQTRGAKR